MDWNVVKAKLLNDSNAVQPEPQGVDQFELPPGVKFHKGWRIYFVAFPDDDIKLEFRVKELGGECALASALAAEKQIRTELS